MRPAKVPEPGDWQGGVRRTGTDERGGRRVHAPDNCRFASATPKEYARMMKEAGTTQSVLKSFE